MAMSLEELLAQDGFQRRKTKSLPRTFGSEGRNTPLLRLQDQYEAGSSLGIRKTERTRSDKTGYVSEGRLSVSNRDRSRKPSNSNRDSSRKPSNDLRIREKIDMGVGQKDHQDSWDAQKSRVNASEDLRVSLLKGSVKRNEIVQMEINKSYKDIYSNDVYSNDGSEGKYSSRNEESESLREPSGASMWGDNKLNGSLKHDPMRQQSLGVKKHESSDSRSKRIPENSKIYEQNLAIPALDEVAVKAMISILSGYVKRFPKDEDFRASLRHNSFSSLNFIGLDGGVNTESKVIENLEQAIDKVERAAEENASEKEIKKASVQLSVITGLNSNDLKDGFTSGIPNFKLSACAHLYLSVVYTIQKKDRIAAKHLLQVFCDSPLQARKKLLPDLWDQIFQPHLLHLKLWYDEQANSTPGNLELLQKVYSRILDSGTYQFAVYYKGWLTEGFEAPSIPSIQVPAISFQLVQKKGLHDHSSVTSSPSGHVFSQPVVSKRLYDEVFRHSEKAVTAVEDYEEVNLDISVRSSNGSALEDKQLLTYSSDIFKHMKQQTEFDHKSLPDYSPMAKEAEVSSRASSSVEISPRENFISYQEGEKMKSEANEFLLKRLAKPMHEPQQFQNSIYHAASHAHSEYAQAFIPWKNKPWSLIQDLQKISEDSIKVPFILNVPVDFVCPLTGSLFEDPVTLETGHTFERAAITDWLSRESKICPGTRKTLECQLVPPTNTILKHVIDNWKSEHFRNLLVHVSGVPESSGKHMNDEVTVYLLWKLLVLVSKNERIINTKLLLSFGGLSFLLRRSHCGNFEEKTRVLALLSFCIEADTACRNEIARNIDKLDLIKLLHNEKFPINIAVSLLTELVCLNGRADAKSFLIGIEEKELLNAADALLIHLQTSVLEQQPLVSVLLLHLDLLLGPQRSNKYREVAVDILSSILENSLSDQDVQQQCCRALLVLGGCFSSSGKLMAEDWILKFAGFLNGPDFDFSDNEIVEVEMVEKCLISNSEMEDEDEEKAREKWLLSVSASLLSYGKKSFLDSISKCLIFGSSNLVRVCLITVAWMSCTFSSLPYTQLQLSAFLTLISPLKQCLEHGELVEHRVLASMSLLNFSKIPECRVLLMNMAEEISGPLESLAEISWTAKELHARFSRQRGQLKG